MEMIVDLSDAQDGYGGKAAHLAGLLAGGFTVPEGFAIAPDAPLESLGTYLERLGDSPVAVRSSALDEDGALASCAGIYDSVLGVHGQSAVEQAIARVRASALAPRALAYRNQGQPARMGVVVQRLVQADCAGVLFTADPVTGDRDARVLTAVRGLGEALVSGEQEGEEWLIRKGVPVRRRALPEPVLSSEQVAELVALGERVAAHFGVPQDIEWVFEAGRLSLVQARPITALPDRVEWNLPWASGYLVRNFRWGEWLSDPVSPLFASWFLPRASAVLLARTTETFGLRPPAPGYVLVNGWYFFAPLGPSGMKTLLGGLLRNPGFFLLAKRASEDPVRHAAAFVEPPLRVYEDELRPRHRALANETLGDDPAALIDYIDRACDLHGDLMFNISFVGGSAWKIEAALAKFFRKHCSGVEGAPHELLAALSPTEACAAHHACSLDWLHPTAGELGLTGTKTPMRSPVLERRQELEAACREQLSGKLRAHFDALLELAQRFARLREEQCHELTLAWPNVRLALARLGERACAAGSIAAHDDVFWLRREELQDAFTGERRFHRDVSERRATWERQRKLAPPLVLGKVPGFMQSMFDALARDLRGGVTAPNDVHTLIGMPASAGRATGRVRLVRSPTDFNRLEPGEVLVAPTTAPAWTPLFARAVAVVTDGGSVAAHASLVAREYGIPAVVGTVEATQRLSDGQLVTVDGTLGRVEISTD